jgi:hypothetical protein
LYAILINEFNQKQEFYSFDLFFEAEHS